MSEQVVSWKVTSVMLEGWGFPVEKRDKCVGMQMVEKPGMPFGQALHAAWAAGFVRIQRIPEEVWEARRQAHLVTLRRQQEHAQETLAFLRERGLIHRTA